MLDNTTSPNTSLSAWIEGVDSASKYLTAFFNPRMQQGPSTHNAAAVVEHAACATLCLAGLLGTHNNTHWIADSSATSHMSTQHHWFKTLKPHTVPICVANNAILYSKGIGLIVMEPTDNLLGLLLLTSVLYVPALQNNLLLVLHLVSNHCFCVKIKGTSMLFLRNGQPMFTVTICNNTAWLNMRTPQAPESALQGKLILDRLLWHCWLGHIGKDGLERTIRGKLADGLLIDSDTPLPLHGKPCIVGKHHCNPFPAKALHCATHLLERIHSNLHKVPVPMASGYWYWITFINNWSRYGWIWLLKKKSDAFKAFKAFKAHVKLQFGAKIACLHNNKGSKYSG
jgi:hypothetical protein